MLPSAHEGVHVSAVIPAPHQSEVHSRPGLQAACCKLHATTGEVRSLLGAVPCSAEVLGA
jgi:hypothetical protein